MAEEGRLVNKEPPPPITSALEAPPDSLPKTDYLNHLIQKSVAWVLCQQGIATAEVNCLEILAAEVEKYIAELGSECKKVTEMAGRTDSNFLDMKRSLQGVDVERHALLFERQRVPASTSFPLEHQDLMVSADGRYTGGCTIRLSTDSWLFAERASKRLEPSEGEALFPHAKRPGYCPMHLPIFPPLYTYQSLTRTANAEGDGRLSAQKRKLEDQLSLQMQLPKVMVQVPHIDSRFAEVLERAPIETSIAEDPAPVSPRSAEPSPDAPVEAEGELS